MEYGDIQKMIDIMGNSNLSALDIEFPDGTKINMRKDMVSQPSNTTLVKVAEDKTVSKTETTIASVTPISGHMMKAPMVGTFYAKASPKAEPFVKVGSHVKKGDVLCVIEAMKLMNEIESEWDGEVKEILVKDGEMVDYGKTLFVIQ